MYKYGFLYSACFILLIAYVCEINEVKGSPKDDLPYWEREPKYEKKASTTDAGAQEPAYTVDTDDPRRSRKVYDFRLEDAHIVVEHFLRDILRRSFNFTPTNTTQKKERKVKKNRRPHASSEQEDEERSRSLRKQPNRVQSSKLKKKRNEKSLDLFKDNSEIYNESRQFPKLRNAFNKAFRNKKEYKGLKPSRRQPVQLAQQADESTTTTASGATGSTSSSTRKDIPLRPYGLQNILQEHFIPNFDDVNITMEVLGRTVEYNDIIMLRATAASDSKYFRSEKTKYMDEVPEKKIVFIVHGLSVMSFKGIPCLSQLDEFSTLTSYYFKHLDKFDIFLMPMANPDGVTKHPMAAMDAAWNKNMSPQSACPGVALDRNFDVAWNDSHVYSSCNQLFPGDSPFSEIETQAVRDTFHKYSHKIIAYFHVHGGTYYADNFKGEAVLYPRGFTESQSDDDKYIDLRGEIDEAMKNASFKVFSVTVDTLYSWYGKVTGTSVDYAATVYGIPYAMELVMQQYENTRGEKEIVLTEVWRRIIDVIFVNMYRASVKAADANDR